MFKYTIQELTRSSYLARDRPGLELEGPIRCAYRAHGSREVSHYLVLVDQIEVFSAAFQLVLRLVCLLIALVLEGRF